MRKTFIKTLTKLAEKDPRIVLLTADLGYTVLECFADRFPDRFVNVGVAEQNMVGVATGMAEAGFVSFVYSIVPFAVLRPYEFIRNGPILHKLPVRIIGVGGGFEYEYNGISHYGLEDVGVMRLQPGITVIAPVDREQAHSALLATWDLPGPVYYRLGKDEETIVSGLKGRFELGRMQLVREGSDLLMIAMGSIASEAVFAAEKLAAQSVSCAVAVLASLNPVHMDEFVGTLARFRLVVTVEAHYVVGGIGSLVSEAIAERGLRCRVVRCGVRGAWDGRSGSRSYMRSVHNLSADDLAKTVFESLHEVKR